MHMCLRRERRGEERREELFSGIWGDLGGSGDLGWGGGPPKPSPVPRSLVPFPTRPRPRPPYFPRPLLSSRRPPLATRPPFLIPFLSSPFALPTPHGTDKLPLPCYCHTMLLYIAVN